MAKSDALYDNKRSPKAKGQQQAKKGDVRDMDNSDDKGNDLIQGRYRSIGIEGKPDGDPDKIGKEGNDVYQRDYEWRKGGKKGPAPSFKTAPKKEEQSPDTGYEIFEREDDKPTS